MEEIRKLQEGLRSGEIKIEDILSSSDELRKMNVLVSHFSENVIEVFLEAPLLFMSDETSIYDFCSDDQDEKQILSLIEKVYSVDVSSIESGNLVEILRFIMTEKGN